MSQIVISAERDYSVEFVRDWKASLSDTIKNGKTCALIPKKMVEIVGPLPSDWLVIELPDGESQKSGAVYLQILERLAEEKFGRDGFLIGLGGGATTDLAGFVAATYMRGLQWVAVPTSLAGMVDAAIGGKTGINLTAGKNLVGNFHQPTAVFADTDLLATLPPREFAAGMAEVIKHGIIADADLFGLLEQNSPLAWNHPLLPRVIRRCVEIKAAVVAGDERETSAQGGRALLNLGHTFGHAIEATAGYGTYLHGEAVAIGLVMAARLSAELKHCTAAQAEQVEATLKLHALPTALRSPLPLEPMLAAMRRDKKVRGGKLRFVLQDGIGAACTADSVPEEAAVRALLAGGAAR